MTLIIDTSPELERQLLEEALQKGMALEEYACLLLERRRTKVNEEKTEESARRPLVLYGIGRGLLPEDVDIEAALREIRASG